MYLDVRKSSKKSSLCHKLWFYNPYFFVAQTINSIIRSNNPSLKYQSFTPKGCKDIGIRKVEQRRNSFICKINGILEFQQKNPIELLIEQASTKFTLIRRLTVPTDYADMLTIERKEGN